MKFGGHIKDKVESEEEFEGFRSCHLRSGSIEHSFSSYICDTVYRSSPACDGKISETPIKDLVLDARLASASPCLP